MIKAKSWGAIGDRTVNLYQFENANGMRVGITNFGATVQSVYTKNADGEMADVVLGYDDLEGYRADPFYMGAIVGRFANRITGGRVTIDGETYQLTLKDGAIHQHGGKEGFNKKVWAAQTFDRENEAGIILEYCSADGEEGFPGNLLTRVTYTLNNKNQLLVDLYAETDKATIVNLTQHAYFNLAGHDSGTIDGHYLTMPMSGYLPVNKLHVPIGATAPVDGTPFDFRQQKAVGLQIDDEHPQIVQGIGYDHTWVIKERDTDELKHIALVYEPLSKRTLNVYTTEPSVHLYTGNYLEPVVKGKNGADYGRRTGLCLEAQHYPDAPNHPAFPSTIVRPGRPYKSRTVFEFGVKIY